MAARACGARAHRVEAEKEKNQQLSRSEALLLGQKPAGPWRLSPGHGLAHQAARGPECALPLHEDEKEGPLLNRSIWFQNAREPLLVVSELPLHHAQLAPVLSQRGQGLLKDSEELNNFTASAAELQLVNINDLSRIQLLAFFLKRLQPDGPARTRGARLHGQPRLQVAEDPLHARQPVHDCRLYNYSLAEIEERLFCRVLRAKFPKKSDKSRAPEPRVHFALSLGCASSPRIRIYQPETLDEDLQQAPLSTCSPIAKEPGANAEGGGGEESPHGCAAQVVQMVQG